MLEHEWDSDDLYWLMARPRWHQLAACHGMTDAFFPEDGGGGHVAETICTTCLVQAECSQAGQNEEFGVWGGMSQRARPIARRRYVGRAL